MPVYVSDRLTATLGVVRGSPTPTRLIQWFRGSTVISGANASTYTVTSADIGMPISVRQTESNYFGSAVATSAATEDVEVFSPSILFSASEPGVWFDPTDAANLAWRRNLLLWSQDWSNIVWTKTDLLTPTNAETAPDSTLTAWKIVPTAASSSVHRTAQFVAGTAAAAHTISVYAKAAGYPKIGIREGNLTGAYATFDLSLGTLIEQSGAVGTIISVGSGWYRCSISFTSGVGVRADIGPLPASYTSGTPVFTFTGDGTSGTILWGAQIEVGSTATTYQPITNLNNEVIAQFPNATLYQDSTGSIPVYAPEQPVGLMLDKSKGLVLGPELVTNGTFDSGTTGWTPVGSTLSVDSQRLKITNIGTAFGFAYQTFPTVVGRTYRISGSIIQGTATAGYLRAGISTTGFEYANFTATSSGNFTALFVATTTTAFVHMLNNNESNAYVFYDNISVKELPGNHATQSTDISRPLYGIVPVSGRRNVLTYSQDFTNAAWTKLATLGSTTETAPDGTATASVISNVSNFQPLQRSFGVTGDIVASVFFKKTSGATYFPGFSLQTPTVYRSVALNTNTGVATPRDSEPVPAGEFGVEDKGTFWRVWIRHTSLTVTYIYPRVNTDAGAVWTGGNGSQTIWGAQVESSTAPTNYQKVTNDYDVTEAGVASVGYLRFDGTNDGMTTPTITTGTDKAQVFTGVRKNSDGFGYGTIVELGVYGTNNGSFSVSAPGFAGQPRYEFSVRGTANSGYEPQSYAAPINNILTSLMDIGAATQTDELTPRVNAVVNRTNANGVSAGTGNFGNYAISIGRNNAATLAFNGQLFPLIVRFGPNMSSALIRTTENWVASKTAGVVLP